MMKNEVMELNKTKLIYIYGIATLIFNSVLRNSLLNLLHINFANIGNINILAFFSVVGLIILSKGKTFKSQFFGIVACLLYILLTSFANIQNGNAHGLRVTLFTVYPAFLFLIFSQPFTESIRVEKKVITYVTYFFLMVFIIGILDYFMGGIINRFIADYMSSEEWARMIYSEGINVKYRMCTIIGSPLMNAYYALMIIVLNYLHYYETGNYIVDKRILYVITFTTIILCGARISFIAAISFVLLTELKEKLGILRVLFYIIALVMVIELPFFSKTIGDRFAMGFSSSYRFIRLQNFLTGSYGRVKFLVGGGYNYSRLLTVTGTSSTANFEFPVIMMLFDYGIVSTVIYYLFLLVYPIILFSKKNRYLQLFSYLTLFFVLQTCNITAQNYDFNLQLAFAIVILDGMYAKRKI